VPPAEITAIAKEQVLRYKTVDFVNDRAMTSKQLDDGFIVTTASSTTFSATKLIFATGLKDLIPQTKGFRECWGLSLIPCPYCHGYEFRNNKTGIMADGERGFHLASLVNNLTDQLFILTNGKADFTTEQREKLNKNNIPIIESEI